MSTPTMTALSMRRVPYAFGGSAEFEVHVLSDRGTEYKVLLRAYASVDEPLVVEITHIGLRFRRKFERLSPKGRYINTWLAAATCARAALHGSEKRFPRS